MYQKFIKRLLDFSLSFIGLIFLIPVFLIIAFLVKKEDGGSVFFRQTRVGQNGKLFKIYKFRTMVEDAEKLGALVTREKDPRITKIGKLLRKYKLDELPQLINVLKGEMSLVGPRPEVPKYVKLYKEKYEKILKVKPGITDFAAVEFIDEEKILNDVENPEEVYLKEILPIKIKYYEKYIREVGFLTDIKLIFKTIFRIFR